MEIPRKLPELALSGGLVCRKRKLKNFIDPETAGGCGVAPFLSATVFFRLCEATSARPGGTDPFTWETGV
ncbi:hypothetical protein ZM68_003232 [Salmonella enterica subsp. diarizonae]|nr:hypothetical protein [Salmonella enterica subsp. diarizonae]